MQTKEIDFDRFLELKDQPSLGIFIFMPKDGNWSLHKSETSWLNYVDVSIYSVKLTSDEFRMLDIGKVPKVIIMRNGKELAEFNGIPDYEDLVQAVRRLYG